MDAKRIIPILRIHQGRVVDAALERPVDMAVRMELAGADEILFLEEGPVDPDRGFWIQAVARALFIPFTVSCAEPTQIRQALHNGASKVLLAVAPEQVAELSQAALSFGRNRLQVAVASGWTEPDGWRTPVPDDPAGRDSLDWMAELGQMGAGELLVHATAGPLSELCQRAAGLALPVLLRVEEPALAAEALLHGADGVAYAADLATPNGFKAALSGFGLALRA